jgi:hypothetical protein
MTVPNNEWARAWASSYDDDDSVLDRLEGLAEFGRAELEVVFEWKLRPRFHKRAIERIANYPEDEIRETTGKAFAATDDLTAAKTLTALPSVGMPVASAILTAQNPERYTVADFRALNSLHAMGFLEDSGDTPNWERLWVPYLDHCRSLADGWEMTLRDADRALWAANGDLTRRR